ncbi:MAG: hypothetical protein V1495_07015 [Pseudomonadota bacterium]
MIRNGNLLRRLFLLLLSFAFFSTTAHAQQKFGMDDVSFRCPAGPKGSDVYLWLFDDPRSKDKRDFAVVYSPPLLFAADSGIPGPLIKVAEREDGKVEVTTYLLGPSLAAGKFRDCIVKNVAKIRGISREKVPMNKVREMDGSVLLKPVNSKTFPFPVNILFSEDGRPRSSLYFGRPGRVLTFIVEERYQRELQGMLRNGLRLGFKIQDVEVKRNTKLHTITE